MDDMPRDLEVLQERLQRARLEHRKLIDRIVAAERQVYQDREEITAALRVMNGEWWPAEDEKRELVKKAAELTHETNGEVTQSMLLLDLLRRLHVFWAETVVNVSRPLEADERAEWRRLLDEVYLATTIPS